MSELEQNSYHHGNLRAELLAAAVEMLGQIGADKLSMRAVSRQLGVSQSAPFRHFKDKNDLLTTLAIEGFHTLTHVQKQAKKGLKPANALIATGVAYVEFACEQPELFKLMFSSKIENREQENNTELCIAGELAYAELHLCIQKGIDQGVFRQRPVEELALAAWAMVHGLAYLAIEGVGRDVPPDANHASVQNSLEIFIGGALQ